MKWNLALPYLTKAEAAVFKRMRDKGQITMFQVRLCQGIKYIFDPVKPAEPCQVEVPRVDGDVNAKRYCSVECYNAMEGDDAASEEDDDTA